MKRVRAQYLFESGDPDLLCGAPGFFLFLDFDGTLVPIRDNPAACRLSSPLKARLKEIALSPRASVAILSGRAMDDVRKRIGLKGIFYGGSHGLEISGPGTRFTHPHAGSVRSVVEPIIGEIEKEIGNIEGALVERKKFGFALHYRMAGREGGKLIQKAFHSAVARYAGNGTCTILRGKKVLELAPSVPWDKGRAVLFLLGQTQSDYRPVYVGDDLTDETAFRALRDKGVTVRIGKSEKTAARYYLKGQWETWRFLGHIAMAIA